MPCGRTDIRCGRLSFVGEFAEYLRGSDEPRALYSPE